MIRTFVALVCSLFVLGASGQAQTAASHETEARVPELDKFHLTIYKIWHTAWPKKDIAMLTALLPDVEKGAASVASATLPGILREKETAWKSGVAKLQECVRGYKAASAAADSTALLAAAEKLHSQFEVLVRTIRPVLKEVGAFHEVLYVLYHYHVPAFAMDSIVTSTRLLRDRMTALDAAVLPARLQAKQDLFTASRASLSKTVREFGAAVETRDRKKITDAMDIMHTAYQALEKVFD